MRLGQAAGPADARPAGTDDPGESGQAGRGVTEMVDHEVRDGGVEAAGGERQDGQHRVPDLRSPHPLPGRGDHARLGVDGDDASAPVSSQRGHRSRPGAGIEHPAAGADPGRIQQSSGRVAAQRREAPLVGRRPARPPQPLMLVKCRRHQISRYAADWPQRYRSAAGQLRAACRRGAAEPAAGALNLALICADEDLTRAG
jgi:hypothetical protein